MSKKVFISVGHGGADSGAVANGFKEKDLNLSISLYVREVLERHGVNVLMSRYIDEDDKTKVKECNAFKPDLAVDVHNNAGGGDGCEVYYHYKGGPSLTLAENITTEIAKTGQNLRLGTSGEKDGLKIKKNQWGRDYFAFIRDTGAPAVIVECAFVDNATDIKIIDTETERKVMGIAIAIAILKTLGIAYIEKKPETTETSGKLYRVQVGAYSVEENAEKMRDKLKADGYDAIIV